MCDGSDAGSPSGDVDESMHWKTGERERDGGCVLLDPSLHSSSRKSPLCVCFVVK